MLLTSSAGLLRKPRTYSALALFVVFALVLSRLRRDDYEFSYGIDVQPGDAYKSPYYYSGGPWAKERYYRWPTSSFFPPLKAAGTGSSSSGSQQPPPPPDYCANFPAHLLDRVQVVLKTGVGEPAKSRASLAAVGSCIANILVFSDAAETIGNHTVIDVLADLPDSYARGNPDFDAYAAQKRQQAAGGAVGYTAEGWRLDRFKFLPMVERAYRMRPDAAWYVFVETDIYYFWDTLFRLLEQLDPAVEHLLGAPVPGAHGLWFPYGGAGWVMSQALMNKFVGRPGAGGGPPAALAAEFEAETKDDCCGDAVLAYALRGRTGKRLEGLFPTFSGSEMRELKVSAETWCVPLLGLHRVGPDDMRALWAWERTRPYDERPFYLSTLLGHTHAFLRDGPTRRGWDNLSPDKALDGSAAHASAAACAAACDASPDCLQYSFARGGVCRLGRDVQLGRPTDDDDSDNGGMVSGWDLRKLEGLGFRADGGYGEECEDATWLRPLVQ